MLVYIGVLVYWCVVRWFISVCGFIGMLYVCLCGCVGLLVCCTSVCVGVLVYTYIVIGFALANSPHLQTAKSLNPLYVHTIIAYVDPNTINVYKYLYDCRLHDKLRFSAERAAGSGLTDRKNFLGKSAST